MKINYKFLIVLSLAIVFVAPHAAEAAWYNPFSWFKKSATPAVIHAIPATTTTSAKTSGYGSATDTMTPTSTMPSKEVKTQAPKPVGTVPPVKNNPAPVVPGAVTRPPQQAVSNPATPASTTSVKETKGDEPQIDVPSFVASYMYLSSSFSQPKNIRTGTEFLALEVKHGDSSALGNWYVDSVTWRIVSDEMRSGDIVIGVSSKQNVVEDNSLVNQKHTTKLSAHAVSDELSFKINGAFPSRGRVHIVIDEIVGYMKGDTTLRPFKGLPIEGPEFSL